MSVRVWGGRGRWWHWTLWWWSWMKRVMHLYSTSSVTSGTNETSSCSPWLVVDTFDKNFSHTLGFTAYLSFLQLGNKINTLVFHWQKQYVFIHRALMEYSQFGNTELSICQVKETYSNHTHHDSMDDSSPLEKEFEVREATQHCFILCLRTTDQHFTTSTTNQGHILLNTHIQKKNCRCYYKLTFCLLLKTG